MERRSVGPEEAKRLYEEMCKQRGHGEELKIAYEDFKKGRTATFDLLTSYHLWDMTEHEMKSLIWHCDFLLLEDKPDLVIDNLKNLLEETEVPKTIYRLEDIQGGNLWDIESDRFDSLEDVVERLEIYIEDLFFR